MDKSGIKSKNRLLKLASSAVWFLNPPSSPNREKAQARKGFSGPMFPVEYSRYKSRSSRTYVTHEPTSPKVSCIGQIKHKNTDKKVNFPDSLPPPGKNRKPNIFKSFQSFTEVKKKNIQPVLMSAQSLNHEGYKKKKKNSVIRNIFGKTSKRNDSEPPADKSRPPSFVQLQRFSSDRNSLSNFDWTAAQISPADHGRRSDGEREWDEEDVKISFSAPIIIGSDMANIEPRKQINLWKRRIISQPQPLQLNTN